jgi:hypothetical protein
MFAAAAPVSSLALARGYAAVISFNDSSHQLVTNNIFMRERDMTDAFNPRK